MDAPSIEHIPVAAKPSKLICLDNPLAWGFTEGSCVFISADQGEKKGEFNLNHSTLFEG